MVDVQLFITMLDEDGPDSVDTHLVDDLRIVCYERRSHRGFRNTCMLAVFVRALDANYAVDVVDVFVESVEGELVIDISR